MEKITELESSEQKSPNQDLELFYQFAEENKDFVFERKEFESIESLLDQTQSFFEDVDAMTQDSLKEEIKSTEVKHFSESIFPALKESFNLILMKNKLSSLSSEVLPEDIANADADITFLAQVLEKLVNGKLTAINNEKNKPKLYPDYFELYFQDNKDADNENFICLKIKPFYHQSPYEEATINIKSSQKDISIRFDRSHYGLGIDISSEAIDKTTARADKLLKGPFFNNQYSQLTNLLKRKSPETHHLYPSEEMKTKDAEKLEILDKVFAKYSLKFLHKIMEEQLLFDKYADQLYTKPEVIKEILN
ncbi:MAG: hypothetical protein GYA31_01615 [Parcubacteria group bacterium]|nr:hypothetical protein [Parcubacteria group bacterium]